MRQLQAEAERARRLAMTTYDSSLARELIAYAAELERQMANQRRDQSTGRQIWVSV
jgi:hypothetical protein